jgi:predicted HTH domain antitoxin
MNRDQSEDDLFHLDDEKLLAEPGIRTALALALYKEEALSVGRAAKLADMSPAEFMHYASRHGIATFRGRARSVREDAKTLDEWLKKVEVMVNGDAASCDERSRWIKSLVRGR